MNRNPEIHQKERKCEERFGKDGQQTDADGRRTTHDPRGHNPPHATSTNLQQRFLSHTNTDSDTLRHQHSRLFYHSKFSILKFPSSTEQIQCLLLVSVNKYHSRLVVDIVDNIQHQSVLIQINGKVF